MSITCLFHYSTSQYHVCVCVFVCVTIVFTSQYHVCVCVFVCVCVCNYSIHKSVSHVNVYVYK